MRPSGQSAISGPALTAGASAVVVSAIVAGIAILQPGADAAVALDRSALLPFSPVAVNQVSESQTLTARNVGGTPVHVDDFLKSGPNSCGVRRHRDQLPEQGDPSRRDLYGGSRLHPDRHGIA